MGQIVHHEMRSRLGATYAQEETAVGTAAKSLLTIAPLTGPAAPFVAAAGALVALGSSLMGLFAGCGSTCDHDTTIVEQFASSFHVLWYSITGEALPGIPGVTPYTTPGNYGNAGINLFQASAYPDVPYPLGNAPSAPDIQLAIQSLTATNQEAMQSMERSQSLPNRAQNYHYFMGLLQDVEEAQATSGNSALSITSALPSWWPIAAAVLVAFAIA